jgi:peptidoglycan glycosyltransferase
MASGLGDATDLRGAVVVVDVVTGQIVAMESRPSFSLMELVDATTWARAEGEERRAGFYHRRLDRVIDGDYPPGSVGKIITAAATLDLGLHDVESEDFDFRVGPMAPRLPDDIEHFTIWHQIEFDDGETISDGHLGHIDDWLFDIEEAFAYSSNVSFSLMAVEVGAERLLEASRAFGYDVVHEVPYYGEFAATIGEADEDGHRYLDGGDSHVAQTGLGQGESLTSPLHLSLLSAAVANDGVAMAPYVVAELAYDDGRAEVATPTPLFDTGLDDETISELAAMMAAAVDYGTAGNATTPGSDPDTRPAGKTGSAQWSDDLDRTHSMFTGFYPRSESRLAIAVVVERGGAGGGVAARIAGAVFASDAVADYLRSVEQNEANV